jgi:hypothetical protein
MQVSIRDAYTIATLASLNYRHSTLLFSLWSYRIRTDDLTWRRRHVGMEWETQICARQQVITVTLLRIQVFWAMTPCRLCVCGSQCFGNNTRHHTPKDLNPQCRHKNSGYVDVFFCNGGVSRGGEGRVVSPPLVAQSKRRRNGTEINILNFKRIHFLLSKYFNYWKKVQGNAINYCDFF